MIQDLDSRVLNYGECYAMKFTDVGKAVYRVQTHPGRSLPPDEDAFTISIRKPSSKKAGERQHTVTVRRKGNSLYAEPDHVEIDQNDVVLWHTDDPAIKTFVICGEGPESEFDSSCITAYSIYTHAFGMEGEYEWVDAYGSKVGGTVVVRSPECKDKKAQAQWLRALEDGNVVTISGEKVHPPKLQVITGQTVVWAIEKAPGISITDARLVQKPRKPRKPKR